MPENTALALQETFSRGSDFVKALVDLRSRGCLVLTPVTWVQQPPQMYQYGFTQVQISLEERIKEVYHDPRWKDGEFALTHRGLAKLWNAAGGEWEVTKREDSRRDPFVVEYLAKGRIKDLQGDSHSAVKHANLDYRDGQPQVLGWTPKQVMEARRKIVERCESMAQNRVIRELLNIRDSYHRDELAFPFVLAKLVFYPDLSDDYVKQRYVEHGLGGTAALFGPPPMVVERGSNLPTPADDLNDVDLEPPHEGSAESPEFATLPTDEQSGIIKALIKQKGYGMTVAQVNVLDLGQRISFYKHLMAMPDPEVKS